MNTAPKLLSMFRSLVLLASLSISSAIASPILKVVDGKLIGADRVDVGGELLDVRFIDGTCADISNASVCRLSPAAPHQFYFEENLQGALLAGQALLDTVLIDSAAGDFDTTPENIFGCPSVQRACFVMTPWLVEPYSIFNYANFQVVAAGNFVSESDDRLAQQKASSYWNTATDDNGTVVYAVWTPSALAFVPEPSTMALATLALLMLALLSRRAGPSPVQSRQESSHID